MTVTKYDSEALEWRTTTTNDITTAATADAVAIPSTGTIGQDENAKRFGGFSKPFFIFNCLLGVAVHGMFLYLMIIVHLQHWVRAAEWLAYFLLHALIPIQAFIIILCCKPSDCTKLCVRPYYSSMAIWALVYVVIGPLFVPELERILVVGLIGLASSLYYWGLLEYWFQMSESKEIGDDEILSAKVVEDPLECA
jgi:hypothetical protein